MEMKLPRWKRREFTRNAVLAGLGLAGVSAAGCTTTTTAPPTTTAPATTTAAPTTTAVVGGTLNVSMVTEPTTLNPYLEKKFGHYATINIFDTATVWRYTEEGIEVVPSLAKSIEHNSAYTQWVVELDSVNFTNGNPLTADDLIFDLQVRIDETLAKSSLNVTALSQVSFQPQANGYGIRLPITKVDDHTVQFDLNSALMFFDEALAQPELGIVPKNYMTANLTSFARNPVGSGPFKFKEWVTADHLTIERNAGWWAGSANLDQVVFKITPQEATRLTELQSGVTDVQPEVIVSQFAQIAANANLATISTPINDQFVLTFLNKGTGTTGFPMNDKRFREAVAFTCDWPNYLKGLYPELSNAGYVHPDWGYLENTWAYDTNRENTWPYKYNMSAAQSLIDTLKTDTNNPDRAQSKIRNLTVVTRSDRADITEYLVTQLRSLGLTVDHVVLDIPSYVTRVVTNKNYDITLWNYRGYGWDPHSRMNEQFLSAPRFFDNGFYNTVIDNLIAQAKASTDRDERIALYRQLDLTAQNDMVEIPTYSFNNIHAFRTNVHDFYSKSSFPLIASAINNTWKG